jgi:hypothetical protein
MKPDTDRLEKFHLEKWYLDCITDEGEAMIFYAAKLVWHRFEVQYTSWLHHEPVKGVTNKSRLGQVQFPVQSGGSLAWNDSRLGISGRWETLAKPIGCRLFESEEGYIDWNCCQPAASAHLEINKRIIDGAGYAEQLIVTLPPWKLNLEKLQWGRYALPGQNMVWIQWKTNSEMKCTWLNGELINESLVDDDLIRLPGKGIRLYTDRGVILESEKRVKNLMAKFIRYLPGIDKSMTLKFFMADETKWLSRSKLEKDGEMINLGWTIHELVTF